MSPLAATLAAMPEAERRAALSQLPKADLAALEYCWPVWARLDQLPPDRNLHPLWRTWLILAGRGFGKTRAGAEATRDEFEAGRRRSGVLISPTADTARRDVVSAILSCSPPWCMPVYEASQRRLVYPNGAILNSVSSEEADRLRGLNVDWYWWDELCSSANQEQVWSNLQLAARVAGPLGDAPAGIITTTPKRSKLLGSIMNDPTTAITRGHTFANRANLDAGTLAYLENRYAGTSLGRQELGGELLDDAEGALWSRALLDKNRVAEAPALRRIVVGVDPAGGSSKTNDRTGIVAVGVALDGHLYVLRDWSGRYSPNGWARRATDMYEDLKADCIVAEANFGGEMVAANLRAAGSHARLKMVHASRGKAIRAEPVVSICEQGRMHHVGSFPDLEDELCSWEPAESAYSPDRLDALVWAATELMDARPPMRITEQAMRDLGVIA